MRKRKSRKKTCRKKSRKKRVGNRKRRRKSRRKRKSRRNNKTRKKKGGVGGIFGKVLTGALATGLTPSGIASATTVGHPSSSYIPSVNSIDTTIPSTQLATTDNFSTSVTGYDGSMPYNTNFTDYSFFSPISSDYSLTTDYGPATRPELVELIKEIPDDIKEDMETNIQIFTNKHSRPPKVTFVCAGNTCRSAFSEDLIRKTFGNSVEVNSAGVREYADNGSSMTPAAQVFACGGKTCQTNHKSQRVTKDNIGNSDLVIFMEEGLMNDTVDHLGYDIKPDNWTVMRSDGVPDPWFPSDTAIPYTSQLGDYENMTHAVIEPMAGHFKNLASM